MNNERRKRIEAVLDTFSLWNQPAQYEDKPDSPAPVKIEAGGLCTRVADAWEATKTKIERIYEEFSGIFEELKDEADSLRNEIEEIKDEEEEAYENMPDSLKGSEKGQESSQAIEGLSNAYEYLSEIVDFDLPDLELPDFEELLGKIDEADAAAQDALV